MKRANHRRGFTLIETLLAAALGSALVLLVVALMGFMDRAEGAQASRLEQIESLSRLHKIMTRTFSSIIVADPNSGASFRAAVNAGAGRDKDKDEPARVLLSPDESSAVKRVARGVQRLEVVLDRPPVPQGFARGLVGSLANSEQANLETEDEAIRGPVRGVFELRPDDMTRRVDGERAKLTNGQLGLTLWWRPLVDERGAEVDPTDDARAVPIVSGLAQCTWKAYIKRKKQSELRVVSNLELPAYMELEARTLGGYHANWMFEVQWSVGGDGSEPETPARPGQDRVAATPAATTAPNGVVQMGTTVAPEGTRTTKGIKSTRGTKR